MGKLFIFDQKNIAVIKPFDNENVACQKWVEIDAINQHGY